MKKILLLLFALVGSTSYAATILTFEFTTGTYATTSTGAIDPAFTGIVTASDYDTHPTAYSGSYGISTGDYATMGGDSTGEATAITDGGNTGVYHNFTLSVTGLGANEQLDLTSLSGDYLVKNIYNDFYLGVYSDASGLTNADILGGASTSTSDLVTPFTVDLTSTNLAAGTDFTGLSNGDSVEFRMYFGDSSSSNTRVHTIDDLVLSGEVSVIPEPSSLLLILSAGLGMTFLCACRKRRS